MRNERKRELNKSKEEKSTMKESKEEDNANKFQHK